LDNDDEIEESDVDDEDDTERNFMRNLSDDGKSLFIYSKAMFLACKASVNYRDISCRTLLIHLFALFFS